MQKFSSPLRYPGGKSSLTDYFAGIIKINSLYNCVYIEPYAGGAGAALNLLYLEYADKIIINDADYNIYCVWHSVLFNPNSFIKLIEETEVNIENWVKQKSILSNNKEFSKLEVGFATFFLNRCNRSGIITGGPIGGRNQKGKWKINARFNKNNLIDRIKKIAFYKERIKIYNLDAIDLMTNVCNEYSEKSDLLFFLDPPYYETGGDLYLNFYDHKDHERLSEYLHEHRKGRWILTYDNVPQITSLYSDKRSFNYNIGYSAHEYRQGNEIIIFSDNLIIPDKNIV